MQDKLIDDILVAVKKTLKEKRDEVETSLICKVPEYKYLVSFNGTLSILRAEAIRTHNPEAIIATLTGCCNKWANEYEKVKHEANKDLVYDVPTYNFLADDIIHVPGCQVHTKNAQSLIIALINHCNKFAKEYKKLKEEKKTKVYTLHSYFTKEGEHTRHIENQEIDVQKELTALVNAANYYRTRSQTNECEMNNWRRQCEKLRVDLKATEENTLLRRKELAAQLIEFRVSLSDIIDNVY